MQNWHDMAARLSSWCEHCDRIVPAGRNCQCRVIVVLKDDYRCPICKCEAGSLGMSVCSECETVFHSECLLVLCRGRCTVLGCETEIIYIF